MTNEVARWIMNYLQIKKKLKNNKIVYSVYLNCKAIYIKTRGKVNDYRAIRNLKRQYSTKTSRPIRVIFILQDLNVWNKTKPIYNALKVDERFETYLLCVPSWYGDNRIISEKRNNDTYDIIFSAGETNIINSLIGKNEWYNICELMPSYVFYTRPYDEYLPKDYRSRIVSKYSRVCYTRYGGGPLLSYDFLSLSIEFRRFCGIYFAATEDEAVYNKNELSKIFKTSMIKSVSVGCPVMGDFVQKRNLNSEVWGFSKNAFRVLWTPRWTTDEYIGGTNFIRFKDDFVDYIVKNTSIDFLIRPHPLMFGNLLNIGEINENEITEFKRIVEDSENANLDTRKEYESTLWGSSVFVTDYSSLISMFFMTGSPIIYCPSEHSAFQNSYIFDRILEVNYVAHSFDEVRYWIDYLRAGKDDKRKERENAKTEIFGKDFYSSPQRIKNIIIDDFEERINRGRR